MILLTVRVTFSSTIHLVTKIHSTMHVDPILHAMGIEKPLAVWSQNQHWLPYDPLPVDEAALFNATTPESLITIANNADLFIGSILANNRHAVFQLLNEALLIALHPHARWQFVMIRYPR